MSSVQGIAEQDTRGWLVRRFGLFGDPARLMSMAEQGLISAANFVALLVLARGFPAIEFGTFSFAYIAAQFLLTLHRSVVLVPFVIHAADERVFRDEARLWQSLNAMVTASSVVVLAMAALVARPLGGPAWMGQAFVMACLFVPANFTYEFLRRWAIQLGRYQSILAAAALYSVVAMAGFLLALREQSIDLAVLAYVAANLAASAVFLPSVLDLCGTRPSKRMVEFLVGLKEFLTWSFLSNLAYNGYSLLPGLILGAIAGPAPVGVFQALRNFTQPMNIVGTAVDNFDKPRVARVLVKQGPQAMWVQLLWTTAILLAVNGPYFLAVGCLARPAVELVYGARYVDHVEIIYYWLVLGGVMLAAYPLETGLMLLRRPDLLFRGRLVSALLAIAVSAASVPALGVAGAMLGLIAGALLSVVFGYLYLHRLIRKDASHA